MYACIPIVGVNFQGVCGQELGHLLLATHHLIRELTLEVTL